jgi:hypothetical protein
MIREKGKLAEAFSPVFYGIMAEKSGTKAVNGT